MMWIVLKVILAILGIVAISASVISLLVIAAFAAMYIDNHGWLEKYRKDREVDNR